MLGIEEALWLIVWPMFASVMAAFIAGSGCNQRFSIPRRWMALLCLGFALSVTLISNVGWEFWSVEDPWKRCFWAACVAGLWSATLADHPAARNAGLAIIAAWSAWLILPRDDSWKDVHPEFAFWTFWLVGCVVINAAALANIVRRNGERWVHWIMVSQSAAVLLLAASAYSALASLCIAVISSCLVFALMASVIRTDWGMLWMVPFIVMIGQLVVTTRLYSSERPLWVYALATFLPALIGAVDSLCFHQKRDQKRVFLAAGLSATAIAIIGWQVFGGS